MCIAVCQTYGQDSRRLQYCTKKKHTRIGVVRETAYKKRQTTRPDSLWPEIRCGMSKVAQKKGEASMGNRRTKARQCSKKLRGIYFIDPDDGGSKETIKKARKKLEIPMEVAMPCGLRTKKRPNKLRETDNETRGSNTIQKTKHACIVEAHESSRKSLESNLPKDHEDHLAESGFNCHYNVVLKFVPTPQAMKIPDAKAAAHTKSEKLEKLPAWQLMNVKSKKEVILEAQGEEKTQKCAVRTEVSKVQRPGRAPR